jgi:hypothetical protein
MNRMRTIWRPIAIGFSAVNLAGAGSAIASGQPLHAGVHVGLAVVFGLWAGRHRPPSPAPGPLEDQVQALEAEVGRLRDDLVETQERLDFAERLLAQRPDRARMPAPPP